MLAEVAASVEAEALRTKAGAARESVEAANSVTRKLEVEVQPEALRMVQVRAFSSRAVRRTRPMQHALCARRNLKSRVWSHLRTPFPPLPLSPRRGMPLSQLLLTISRRLSMLCLYLTTSVISPWRTVAIAKQPRWSYHCPQSEQHWRLHHPLLER